MGYFDINTRIQYFKQKTKVAFVVYSQRFVFGRSYVENVRNSIDFSS